ncbi:MAG: cupin domain-containing protein [Gammaproteobacteria bacterium]|nr:cupin domain-containing protein [Gammaproteobacteria bacterium]
MKDTKSNTAGNIIAEIIPLNGYFPNNSYYPVLIYKQIIAINKGTVNDIQHFLKQNGWHNTWVNSIYDYHHYHSNTHEALVVYEGDCKVQLGGPNGKVHSISQGDVIIFPVGVAHKNIESSKNFKCIGAYPFDIDYDMHYGKKEEHPAVDHNIKSTPLPKTDPIFGEQGLLFNYWKNKYD